MRLLPLLLATALAAGEGAPAAPAAELHLTAVPSGVSRSSSLWFEEGKLRGGQDSLGITLHAKLPHDGRVVEVDSVTVVEAVADNGAKITWDREGNGGSAAEDGLDLNISSNAPPTGVRSLRRLVVTAQLHLASTNLRRAVLKPAKDMIAKRMRIDGYDGAEVELENLGAEELTLGMSPILAKALANLGFRNAAGDEIPSPDITPSDEPGWSVRHVAITLPADGMIVLDLLQDVRIRKVVLTATDVPISLPDHNKTAAGTLQTEIIADPVKADATLQAVPVIPVEPAAAPKPGF